MRDESEILRHLSLHGVVNKDALTPVKSVHAAKAKSDGCSKIDLHGLIATDAEQKLLQEIEKCKSRGIKKLLAIHGYGLHSNPVEGPVLKNMVRQLLNGKANTIVRSWRPAKSTEGGEGATMVFVK